jgi:predicted ABC-type transport system involved in lysophospholipase L1 biosynthesis ATPase subunit
MDLLHDLHATEGLTFVVVTHDEGIGRGAQRLVTMRDGAIVEDQQLRAARSAAAGS